MPSYPKTPLLALATLAVLAAPVIADETDPYTSYPSPFADHETGEEGAGGANAPGAGDDTDAYTDYVSELPDESGEAGHRSGGDLQIGNNDDGSDDSTSRVILHDGMHAID